MVCYLKYASIFSLDVSAVRTSNPVKPDGYGNYVLGDMILSREEYLSEYGDVSLLPQRSGLVAEGSRWKNGGNMFFKRTCDLQFRIKVFFFSFFAELPYSTPGISGRDKIKIEKALKRLNQDLYGCINIRFVCVCFSFCPTLISTWPGLAIVKIGLICTISPIVFLMFHHF